MVQVFTVFKSQQAEFTVRGSVILIIGVINAYKQVNQCLPLKCKANAVCAHTISWKLIWKTKDEHLKCSLSTDGSKGCVALCVFNIDVRATARGVGHHRYTTSPTVSLFHGFYCHLLVMNIQLG